MPEVSVIICSHNPKLSYLQRTLNALKAQAISPHRWELILVDNASRAPWGCMLDTSWHPNVRRITESELGLAPARRRGINEASTDLLIFVDDDNLLDPSYLSEALIISREWTHLGTFGSGTIVPEFERQPADHLTRFLPLLALRQTNKDVWTNMITSPNLAPWGAGLCVRRAVAKAYCEFSDRSAFKIIDRRGKSLVSGQDVEIGYFACTVGLGMGIFTRLKLTHLIPKERIEPQYLLRLAEGQELSCALLAYKWLGISPRPSRSFREALSLVKTVLFRREIDRKVHLANRRATAEAKRIIAAYQNEAKSAR